MPIDNQNLDPEATRETGAGTNYTSVNSTSTGASAAASQYASLTKENRKEIREILNDLIKINNDRIVGYEKAAKQADALDADLISFFNKMANESREYSRELTGEIVRLGGEGEKVTDDTTLSGKIYRAWMDVKNLFTGADRKSILESCEFGEDAAQKAYNTALDEDIELPSSLRQMLINQKMKLEKSHNMIKKYRDINK